MHFFWSQNNVKHREIEEKWNEINLNCYIKLGTSQKSFSIKLSGVFLIVLTKKECNPTAKAVWAFFTLLVISWAQLSLFTLKVWKLLLLACLIFNKNRSLSPLESSICLFELTQKRQTSSETLTQPVVTVVSHTFVMIMSIFLLLPIFFLLGVTRLWKKPLHPSQGWKLVKAAMDGSPPEEWSFKKNACDISNIHFGELRVFLSCRLAVMCPGKH